MYGATKPEPSNSNNPDSRNERHTHEEDDDDDDDDPPVIATLLGRSGTNVVNDDKLKGKQQQRGPMSHHAAGTHAGNWQPSSRTLAGARAYVGSALGPMNDSSPKFETSDDDNVPFFDVRSRPGSRIANETLQTPRHLADSLLNLGELVVEGAFQQSLTAGGDGGDEDRGVFESFFDLTRPRLKVIFDALDVSSSEQKEGVADFQHLRRGLADAGVRVDNEQEFARLVEQVDQDLDGGLTFNEFEAVVQSLKMAYLLKTLTPEEANRCLGTPASPKVRVIDYSVARLVTRSPNFTDLPSFLYGPRPDFASTRWIDVTAPSDFVIKGLAVKYRFHPLALEDVLNMDFSSTSKLDRYENHMFLVFPGMILESAQVIPQKIEEEVDRSVRRRNRGARSRFLRNALGSSRTLLVSPPMGSTAEAPLLPLSHGDILEHAFSQSNNGPTQRGRLKKVAPGAGKDAVSSSPSPHIDDGELGTVELLATFPGVAHFNVALFLTWKDADTLITVVEEVAGGGVFRRVRSELQVSYSRLRGQSALFLMYTVLDVLVDGYTPVMDAFEEHIAALRVHVREQAAKRGILFDAKTDSDFLARYHDVLSELMRARRRLTPAIRVLANLTSIEEVDVECRVYLRDVLDHAEDVVDRLNGMLEDCRALKAEQQHSIDAKLTRSMAGLTFVGVVFMPAQFLTGFWGTNFDALPLRSSPYGVPFFVLAIVVSWLGTYALLRWYRIV